MPCPHPGSPTAGAPARLRSRPAVPGPTTQPETGSSATTVTLPAAAVPYLPGWHEHDADCSVLPSQRISCSGILFPVNRRHTNGIYIPTGAAQSCSSISFSSTLTLHSRLAELHLKVLGLSPSFSRPPSVVHTGRDRIMAGYGDDGVDLTELTLGPPGVNARKARRARKNGQQPSSSAMYVSSPCVAS